MSESTGLEEHSTTENEVIAHPGTGPCAQQADGSKAEGAEGELVRLQADEEQKSEQERQPVAGDDGQTSSVNNVEEIGTDATGHLAEEQANPPLNPSDVQVKETDALTEGLGKMELPASPPPPPVPMKDVSSSDAASSAKEEHFDEKQPLVADETHNDFPEPSQGHVEPTGEEIQNIMEQFQAGNNAPKEEEIMSPVLELQQPMFVLPPRTSSLENRSEHQLSPQTTGGSVSRSPISPTDTGKAGSVSGVSVHKGRSDDTESIVSAKASSIFQPPPPSPEPESSLPFDFQRFLEQLRHRTADPVARFLRSFLSEFGKKQWMVHEQVKLISDFLQFIAKRMAQCEVWRTVSDAEFDNAREGMEKLVMNRLYSQTFSPAIPPLVGTPRKAARNGARSQADAANPQGAGRRGQHQEDVERDEVIAQKLRIYGWITEEHLDIKPINDKGRKFLSLAQQELLKINTYRAPRDKVICVLNCCKVIFGFLKNSRGDQSADAFVPLLIYTVLRARPENLVSNVQYIWRFRTAEKLGGEAGYYMSSLMGVVAFVENLDRTNLTITDEEFEKNVEQAVSAIAQENKAEEYEEKTHASTAAATGPLQRLNEKSALSRPEVTPRNSMDAEQSSPRRNASREKSQLSSSDHSDDSDAVSGLLRTIQKPLSSIGRIFSDDASSQQQSNSLRPGGTPLSSSPRRVSPARSDGRGPSADGRARAQDAAEATARQASVETAQAQNARSQEYRVVVETLQNMFPNLDKEVIEDVVRAQEGNVGRAVDACLAVSG